MAKRLRTLASLLWDDDDPVLLNAEYKSVQCKRHGNSLFTRAEGPEEEQLPRVPHCALAADKPQFRRSLQKDPWFWLQDLPEQLVALERFKDEVVADLTSTSFADGAVCFDLCSSRLASSVLAHAELTVRSFSARHPALHKIGVTSNPTRRWLHTSYGYKFDKFVKWDSMTVVHAHEDPDVVCFLEAALIRVFHARVSKHPLGWRRHQR